MKNTKDDDKKAVDKNAARYFENITKEENRQKGKHAYSKKTDHL
ncbi:DUF3941 domain-containing protein [Fictibacillus sp. Mic-4]|nr:DUF3941 domain-containing protein [Fictibacillus gelatini]